MGSSRILASKLVGSKLGAETLEKSGTSLYGEIWKIKYKNPLWFGLEFSTDTGANLWTSAATSTVPEETSSDTEEPKKP